MSEKSHVLFFFLTKCFKTNNFIEVPHALFVKYCMTTCHFFCFLILSISSLEDRWRDFNR